MTWRPAGCLVVFNAELDELFPDRPPSQMIGDERHQQERSDHNPNAAGVVTADDVLTAPWTARLAEYLRFRGQAGDSRIKYVIWDRHITSAQHGWQWASYGPCPPKDPHTGHLHLSVSADPDLYDQVDSWHLATALQEDPDMTPELDRRLKLLEGKVDSLTAAVTALVAPRPGDHSDPDKQHTSLGDVLTRVDTRADQILAATTAGKDTHST